MFRDYSGDFQIMLNRVVLAISFLILYLLTTGTFIYIAFTVGIAIGDGNCGR